MKRFALLMIFALVAVAPANAEGWYFDFFAGIGETDDTDFAVNGTSRIDTEFDSNTTYGVSFGYMFANQLRFEGEISQREADVDSHQLDNGGAIAGSFGEIGSTSIFANLFYDFANESRVTPYVGVGVGSVSVDFDGFGVPGLPALDDDDDVFGYQLAAGLDVMINDAWSFRTDVRLLEAEDAEVTSSAATGSTVSEAPYSSYDLTVGLRYKFGN